MRSPAIKMNDPDEHGIFEERDVWRIRPATSVAAPISFPGAVLIDRRRQRHLCESLTDRLGPSPDPGALI